MAEQLDVVVIGGGPGGYVAAIRAARLGNRTAVVESTHLGGICLNWGCIPSKALLHTARLYDNIRGAGDFGLHVGEVTVNWKEVIGHSRDVAERLSKGIEFLFKKYGVTYHPGRGALVDTGTVRVTPEKGRPFQLKAERTIIATGARPRMLPGVEADGKQVITSHEAMILPSVPKRLVIVGAGAIGVEFAYLYNVFGSKVTLVELLPRILPLEDEDISKELARLLKKQGIEVRAGTRVDKIQRQKSQVKVQTSPTEGSPDSGPGKVIAADRVLLALGVRGNVEDLGLEAVGIDVQDGAIRVDENYRTNVAGIYAIGDVIGPPLLAHAASAEAQVAVGHLAGLAPEPLDVTTIPACTYCQPQVASVGLTERAAREAGYEVKVGKYPFRTLGKSQATGERDGFVKVVYDAKYGELLGTHIIGDGATDIISEMALARRLETTYHEVLTTAHPHPTISEAIQESTAMAYGVEVNS